MILTRRYAIILFAVLQLHLQFVAAQNLIGTTMRLRPSTLILSCNNGDLKVDENDSTRLKMCRSNSWQYIAEGQDVLSNPFNGTLSITGALTVTGNTTTSGVFVGNLLGNVTGSLTGNVVGNLTGTASQAGTASAATAFTATPTGCAAGQYAQFIAPTGNLTCAQVSFSQLSGTASIAQGGTNNGTLSVTAGGVLYADGTKLMNTGAGSSGMFLMSNGSSAPTWANVNVSVPVIVAYTSGTGVHTVASGARWLRVMLVGGGGGGGSNTASNGVGSGGGGGACLWKILTSLDATYNYSVGLGGGGQTASGNGTAGTATTFGTALLSAGGGSQGANGTSATTGGSGGSATGGDVNISGQTADTGDDSDTFGRGGGGSCLGGGAAATNNANATVYGGGGSGSQAANDGGDGRAGIAIVETYF